ncbi:MAG: Eco57I restriction-modification methylase domain-containing protein [Cyanobacteria bacterium SZAS LIN-5]|nr:Eco57I restriction-modification methylase domain-containing protein [Cyanobacteria bacterium SZAS LIN-5]
MSRQSKLLQHEKLDERLLVQLKEVAIAFVRQRLVENCKSEICNCAEILPDLFVEAVKFLPGYLQSAKITVSTDELCTLLGCAYEHLLLYTVKGGKSGQCSVVAIEKSKKQLGNFYTPVNLASLTVEDALKELVFDPSGQLLSAERILALKIVDPSMGCGIFLSAALSYLSERLFESRSFAGDAASTLVECRRDVAVNCLYGVDLDFAAVRVARHLLALQCGITPHAEIEIALEQKLKCGNSLVGILPGSRLVEELQKSKDFGQAESDSLCNELLGIADGDINPFKYFHWPLQFPALFSSSDSGFDAVLGNPPWEIIKPNSREFFQQKHERFWTLGKQEALRKQDELRAEADIDDEWMRYRNNYKLFSQWILNSGCFRMQGTSDINAYKLFVELSLMIVRSGGVVSLIVPSSLYSDKGSSELRQALLRDHEWRYLRAFQNSEGIFEIHRSFKFCLLHVRKSGETKELTASFDLRSIEHAKECQPIKLTLAQLKLISPNWLSVPEVDSVRDLQLVEKLANNNIRFEEFATTFDLKFRREFDMTNDSSKFILRDDAEQIGYKADVRSRWLLGNWKKSGTDSVPVAGAGDSCGWVASACGGFVIAEEDIVEIALPLYEGRMIGQFDVSQKGWVRGKGRQALWLPVPDGRVLPQYLVSVKDLAAKGLAANGLATSGLSGREPGADSGSRLVAESGTDIGALKLGFLGVGSATNMRSMIAACLGQYPCGNSVPTFHCSDPKVVLALSACLNSFVFDYLLRLRLVGNNLNYFILQECFLPRPALLFSDVAILEIAARLNWNERHFAPALKPFMSPPENSSKLEETERLRLRCALDALIADIYGLDVDDLEYILRGCDSVQPGRRVKGGGTSELKASPRGFWRVDKEKPPEARQTVLTLDAFRTLKTGGRSELLGQNEKGLPGWSLTRAVSTHI